MRNYLLVFPNQLYEKHPGFDSNPDKVILIEDGLFFGDQDYPLRFHCKKLTFQRTAMKKYEAFCRKLGLQADYWDHEETSGFLFNHLQKIKHNEKPETIALTTLDPVDYELRHRLEEITRDLNLPISFLNNCGFINTRKENEEFIDGRKRWFMADFYRWQRKRLNLLMQDGKPIGGKWSFDHQNRKKVPRSLFTKIPQRSLLQDDIVSRESNKYVTQQYKDHPGVQSQLHYPTSHEQADTWLDAFLEQRFQNFGNYEDAIIKGENTLWHSVLSPLINTGLLTPHKVLSRCLAHADSHQIPLNSTEGFIRQLIGWREFVRATYEDLGCKMRTSNHWEHYNPIPKVFYHCATGLDPVDDCLKRVETTAYCHHIERLMILGGFLFLCEVSPQQIYRWFMEMFIDSYDWVMVPNVYSMSQHADGGLITTKPYFCGSSYIRRMSNYPRGNWCEIYDGLYWRWIWKNRKRLSTQPRWAMMCKLAEKMGQTRIKQHLRIADNYLSKIM
ncbi:MAG: cryptochrome/photolyase family protein [Planctomycetaceae bacterium]|nr:cryptochrome/photolyase family protein [Planctomycetaceae bacterium]